MNGKNLLKAGLSERQIQAMLYIKEKGKITNKEYQKLTAASKRTATRELSQLAEKNLIEKVGTTGKGTGYVLKGAAKVTKEP
jgi:ATP-dependent DNA helicase RecG